MPIDEYREKISKLNNFIPCEGKQVQKRKSFIGVPFATSHSQIVIHMEDDFIIYEQYGTQYIKDLREDKK